MTTLKKITMITLFSLAFNSCNANFDEKTISKLTTSVSDTTSSHILTITKVKKPWYAWRSLVVGKMKESIPTYQKIKGLNEKYFSFVENHNKFGGIYFWKSEQDANNLFNKDWYNRIADKYGEKGIVEYYKIKKMESVAIITDFKAKNLYATISHKKNDFLIIDKTAHGLLKIITLQDDKNQTFYLTVWQKKEHAKKYFISNSYENEYFDIPIFFN